MLLELLEKGYGSAMDLNCAEKILYGANWAYDLKLSPEALKLAAGFGGGLGVGSVCGTITGAVMVLSHLYVQQYAHESGRIKVLEEEFITAFNQEFKCLDCKTLKAKYRTPQGKCDPLIFQAAAILD
ncbi:MAG: C-GCAxxG-C-C family protein, partial [Acidaminococcaceae bacterium]